MTAIIEKWQPLFDEAGNTPVGTITADINRGGIPPGSDRGVESAAGNLVADAQLWSTSANGARLAFMNPGGVRSDLTYAAVGGLKATASSPSARRSRSSRSATR